MSKLLGITLLFCSSLNLFSINQGLLQVERSETNNSAGQKSFYVRVGAYKSGDSVTITQFIGLDSIRAVDRSYKIVSYGCVFVPTKGQMIMLSGSSSGVVSNHIKVYISRLSKTGDRAYFDNIILKNNSREIKKAKDVTIIIR